MSQNIKGGGRAFLSDAAEQALVELLMRRRGWPEPKSEHDRKRERKRFLKQLVEQYERRHMMKTFNASRSNLQQYQEGKTQQTSAAATHTSTSASTGTTSTKPTADLNAKVRVELVEAVYSKKGKKSTTSNTKDDKAAVFKEGARKIMVFARSTSLADVKKQAQSKLRIKKKPQRAFVIVEQKTEMDLVGDLSGISDGVTIYISAQQEAPKEEKAETIEGTIPTANAETTAIEEAMEDPLEPVKQAYAHRRRTHPRNHHKINTQRPISHHPPFSDHFDTLPDLSEERASLPAAACRQDILQAVQDHRVVVICGATGCGKSTQVPQFLLEGMTASGTLEQANILVTQPRRVAAISLAQRVSYEMKSSSPGHPNSQVGYQVRLDRSVSDTAKIVYCTVGILLRRLVCPKEDNFEDGDDETAKEHVPLSTVSHVVIDEVHERDMNTDFCLTLLRAGLRRNPHLRIILMSATASADLFVNYFASHEPSVMNIPGRSFPVQSNWLVDCERFASSCIPNFKDKIGVSRHESLSSSPNIVLSPRATDKIDNNFIKDLIVAIVGRQQRSKLSSGINGVRTEGAVLVFLPGRGEIEALARVLYDDPTLGTKDFCNILKLHSAIPRGSQQIVFEPAPVGTMKIVLATNIAETSITIQGKKDDRFEMVKGFACSSTMSDNKYYRCFSKDVSHVIDTGRVKESRFNASTRIKELVTVWTSRASAKQRAGRAGRTSAGVCWKLYSERFAMEYMPEHTTPEIVRTPLDELIMQVCLLYEQRRDEQANKESLSKFPKGACPIRFLKNTPEPPPEKSLQEACKHLLEVDALKIVDRDQVLYRLTPLGYHLSRLPMDAKVGKVLIVGCILECLDGALTVAATLSCNKSCFFNRWGSVDSAYESAVNARNGLVESGFGGRDWKGGTVKGDLIASIACYNEWRKRKNDKQRANFCRSHALDNMAMKEIHELRIQFLDCLADAGFVTKDLGDQNKAKDDALLTSCCLVAGLYPNICTLMRPRKGGPKGGRLLTKEGDSCRPQSGSFQRQRISKAAETGKDAHAVYHNKHRSIGTGSQPAEVFLSEVNFVSRFALLLFGGELEVINNAIVVDGWLKFKIGDKGVAGSVLLLALRNELDSSMLHHIVCRGEEDMQESRTLMAVVRQLLAEE